MSGGYLTIRNLSAVLRDTGERVLRSVDIDLQPGTIRGLVGESGAGKSMIGKAVLGVLPKALKVVEGEILIDGQDLLKLKDAARRIDRAHSPGPADRAQSLAPDRAADHQPARRHSRLDAPHRRGASTGSSGRGADRRPCARHAAISTRAIGWHAPAHPDRLGLRG
jgi:energy-coupling factor transporter ATP-binding protein EcfA2